MQGINYNNYPIAVIFVSCQNWWHVSFDELLHCPMERFFHYCLSYTRTTGRNATIIKVVSNISKLWHRRASALAEKSKLQIIFLQKSTYFYRDWRFDSQLELTVVRAVVVRLCILMLMRIWRCLMSQMQISKSRTWKVPGSLANKFKACL